MSLLYPDTVTVYNRLGGEGRAVSWQRTVLTEAARVFDPIGTVRAPGGDRPAAVATAVIAVHGKHTTSTGLQQLLCHID